MTSFLARAGLLTTCLLLGSWNDTTAQTPETPGLMRATPEMLVAPRTQPAEGFSADGVEAVFYDGPPWKGKPTRVFAWIGVPKLQPGEKAPGIVLVHGGGGTAFESWVRLWVGRGYAAIAMDTCGAVPKGSYGKWERHEAGGPPGYDFTTSMEPVADQWPYHAVADVLLAHSLLRSRPEVDADRIGVTGISWGGYLTCIVSGLDDRFKFAAPVYGCGFLGDNSVWKPELEKLGERGQRWLALWDPSHYLPLGKAPKLWVTGTNDFAYPLDSLRKSYRAAGGSSTLCVRLRMPHGHGPAGENPEEIHAFADSILKGGKPLVEVSTVVRDGSTIRAAFAGQDLVASAQLLYTKADGSWPDRLWETAEARVDQAARTIDGQLPTGATAYFLNLIDPQGRVVSTQLRMVEKTDR
ncbi:alpha/beta hydrolase family protein [Paludisphaera borealis]|uniref:Putative alpha/beta-hydrolase-type carbohydrate esterase (Acetyl xylan esterase) n=1 Tax=Paludisphaera borealis TaxID=1387353 RepID=A0A1U7CNX6_9BACT|nr:acetylxylan esterase [Paludisphaera borealis]APW60606.1 putative alpha/beta-hydrolase-type carbohydrate esterase (acetyl xylan esterase) [Paludisphaera borealis]